MGTLFLVDCEAYGGCPRTGQLTEVGIVEFKSRKSFHGIVVKSRPSKDNPAVPEPAEEFDPLREREVFEAMHKYLKQFPAPFVFVSDNPAFDWQWINDGCWRILGMNPFGHSARRIGDFWAGLNNDYWNSSRWKKLRVTKHTHYPVDDAMGNAEALRRMLDGER